LILDSYDKKNERIFFKNKHFFEKIFFVHDRVFNTKYETVQIDATCKSNFFFNKFVTFIIFNITKGITKNIGFFGTIRV